MSGTRHKYGTIGYIVGYDGQLVDGEVPKGKYVLPPGGFNAQANFHLNKDDAVAELGDRTTHKDGLLGGVRTYVLKVHKVKLSWFPFAEGHNGYKKVAATA